jgi:hypothetical protein
VNKSDPNGHATSPWDKFWSDVFGKATKQEVGKAASDYAKDKTEKTGKAGLEALKVLTPLGSVYDAKEAYKAYKKGDKKTAAIYAAVAILGIMPGEGAAAKVGLKAGEKAVVKEVGAYTIIFESGTKYHGKGPVQRMELSAKQISSKFGDPAMKKEFKMADTNRQAFKDEYSRLMADGGPKSDTNYNKIQSPGARYSWEDKE